MRKDFADMNEKLKSTKLSWKIYLLLALYFEYNRSNTKVEKECLFVVFME